MAGSKAWKVAGLSTGKTHHIKIRCKKAGDFAFIHYPNRL